MTHFGFPYRIGRSGATEGADVDRHVRDLIEQVLFTAPGGRVNRPTFGSGLLNLVFAPGSDEIAAATQYVVHGALQQYLSELILVESVSADFDEGTLTVRVVYRVQGDETVRSETFARGIA